MNRYPNTGATNETGFTALPGGDGNYVAAFNDIVNWGTWWTATELDATSAWYWYMGYNTSNVGKNSVSKRGGMSIRCIKD